MEEHLTTPASRDNKVFFDGSWELSGKNLNAAAVTGLLVIGAIYINVQSIISVIISLFYLKILQINLDGSYIERLTEFMKVLSPPLRVIVLITQFSLMLYPTIWLIKKWHTSRVKEYIRLNKCTLAEAFLAVIITVLFIPTGELISSVLINLLNIPDFYLEIGATFFKADSFNEYLWLIFVIAVTPAICEEVFFRGYVQRTFERTIGKHSFWVVGIIFGLFHLQPLGLITLALMGILFGYFYYISKSIIPNMIAHFTNNLLALTILYGFNDISSFDLSLIEQMPLSWVIGSFILGFICLYLYRIIAGNRLSKVNNTGTIN